VICTGRATAENFLELVIRKHSDIAGAFARVKEHQQISNACLEEISGLCGGFVDKLLGRTRTKKLGPTSFDLLIGALGLELVVGPNSENCAENGEPL
jgi:hypothetical protein